MAERADGDRLTCESVQVALQQQSEKSRLEFLEKLDIESILQTCTAKKFMRILLDYVASIGFSNKKLLHAVQLRVVEWSSSGCSSEIFGATAELLKEWNDNSSDSSFFLIKFLVPILAIVCRKEIVPDVKPLLRLLGNCFENCNNNKVDCSLVKLLKCNEEMNNVLLDLWLKDSDPLVNASDRIIGCSVNAPKFRYALVEELRKHLLALKPNGKMTLGVFSNTIGTLTTADWCEPYQGQDSLELIVIKALKKIPEGAAVAISWFMSKLQPNVDLSSFVLQGAVASIQRMLKSSDANVRLAGLTLTENVSVRCVSESSYEMLLMPIADMLKTGASLTESYQKPMIVLAVRRSLRSLASFGAAASGIAAKLFTMILAFLEKETQVNCKWLLAQCAGICLAHMGGGAQSQAVEEFAAVAASTISKAGHALAAPYLLTLAAAVSRHRELVSYAAPLIPGLIAMLKESTKKVAMAAQLDLVFATSIIIDAACVSKSSADAFEAAKRWPLVFGAPTSFLYNKALMAQLGSLPQELNGSLHEGSCEYEAANVECMGALALHSECIEALTRIAATALCQFPKQIGLPPNGGSAFLIAGRDEASLQSVLVRFLLHESHSIQLIAQRHAGGVAQDAGISLLVLKELWATLRDISEQNAAAEKDALMNFKQLSVADESRPAQSKLQRVPPPSRVFAAVSSLLPPKDAVPSASPDFRANPQVAVALLLCAHPFVSPSDTSVTSNWKHLQGRFPQVLDHSASADFTAECLDRCFSSESAQDRAAAFDSLRVLADYDPSLIESQFIPLVLHKFCDARYFSLQPDDLAVYRSPESVMERKIAEYRAASAVSASDIEITNADRKKTGPRSARRGMFGADTVEDEDWAARVKQKKAAKLMSAKQSEEDEKVAEIRAAVTAHRDAVKGIVNQMTFNVQLLQAFAKLPVDIASHFIVALCRVGFFVNLFATAHMDAELTAATMAVVRIVVDADLRHYTRDLVDSLRIVSKIPAGVVEVADPDLVKRIIYFSNPVVRLLRGVYAFISRHQAEAIESYPMKPSTFYMLFPILRCMLKLPVVIPGTDICFDMLDSLWPFSDMISDQPEIAAIRDSLHEVLEVALVVLSRTWKSEPPADRVVVRMVSDVSELRIAEWDVLLGAKGLQLDESRVRACCMEALSSATTVLNVSASVDSKLWLGLFDESDEVRGFAQTLWKDKKPLRGFFEELKPLLSDKKERVRRVAAKALAGAVKAYVSAGDAIDSEVVSSLQQLYVSCVPAKIEQPKPQVAVKTAAPAVDSKKSAKDNKATGPLIMPVIAKKQTEDVHIALRVSIAKVIGELGEQLALRSCASSLIALLEFLTERGVIDPVAEVRSAMVASSRSLVDRYGKEHVGGLLELFQRILARKPSAGEDLAEFDNRYSAAVVLLGATGKHLRADDPGMLAIVETLVTALSTPSESVQRAVADCLVPLVMAMKANLAVHEKFDELIQKSLNAPSYGERRGAAFGFSAFAKGLGASCLKQHGVIEKLASTGAVNSRQGALMGFECLTDRLGILFEPYLIAVIPIILKSCSHSSDHIHTAAQLAMKVIMGRLSAHGVKQVLAPILASLPTESAWKSRQEAINLLGTMAHCAPKQLAACLPQIVPALVSAGSDPHPKVKDSAKAALADISSVIKNPEVSRLSPVLLAALGDPANKTKDALAALLECEFMHSIDMPSLALLIPILGRALRDRGPDIKRKSAAITGNMVGMISDPKALVPYIPQIVPGIKDCLMDPTPDIRAVGSKALGSLFTGVGEGELRELVPWLASTLRSDASPVERSGAAQGLAEVCSASSSARVSEILEIVFQLQFESRSASREGLLWFLSFLPLSLNEAFATYISISLPVILSGLSDDSEGVREVAMRAGQVIVSKLGYNNTLELLPSLLNGVSHDDWRIRQSSVKLLGELLFLVGDAKVAGFTEMAEGDEEEDGNSTQSANRIMATIREHIGTKHADAVVATLYIARSDISSSVRQTSLMIWKTIVSNTPRALVEVMGSLVQIVIEKIAAESEDMRIIAGRALGELIRKLGDKVLPSIMPHIRQGLQSRVQSMREGVCAGLAEILTACTKKQAEDYIGILIPAIKQALCDESMEVCELAAKAFMTLFKTVGSQAIDQVVPSLLSAVQSNDEESELALRGLREIVSQRPRDLMEYLLPTLVSSPMQVVSARALANVVEVGGGQLMYHFQTLLPSFVQELYSCSDKVDKLKDKLSGDGVDHDSLMVELQREIERFDAVKLAASAVMAAITTTGVHYFINEIGKQIEHETSVKRRRWGTWLMEQFVSKSRADCADYMSIMLKFVLSRVAETDAQLLQAVCDCLTAISASVSHDVLIQHVDFIRNCVSSTASAARHRTGTAGMWTATGEFLLPLLRLPKSLDPLANIYLYGLMNGNEITRELSADALGEAANVADFAVLKPLLIKTTGPLIRIAGERHGSSLKAAIIQTLSVLLDKGGVALKAFVPQLQTTFIKSLNDPGREVRSRAAVALGKLIALGPRIDAIFNELSSLCMQADSTAIKFSILSAIESVLSMGGDKATPASLDKLRLCFLQTIGDPEEQVRNVTSQCLLLLTRFLGPSQVTDVLIDLLDTAAIKGGSDPLGVVQAGKLVGVGSVIYSAGGRAVEMREEAFAFILQGFREDRVIVKSAACKAVLTMLGPIPPNALQTTEAGEDRKAEFRTAAQTAIHHFSAALTLAASDPAAEEIRATALTAIKQSAKHYFGASSQHMKEFVPAIVAALKDINTRVKYCAERALKYLSEGVSGKGEFVFQVYVQSNDTEASRFAKDYVKKIIVKLAADSGDEGAK